MYRKRLADGNLSADERAAILAEMEGKMAMINDLIGNEEAAQNSALADALARRRAKKEKLKNVINGLAAQKDAGIEGSADQLSEIKTQEQADIVKIEVEIDHERKQGGRDIEDEISREKKRRLETAERRLNDFKRKAASGANEDKFADMLNEYGNLVKKVEGDLASEKEQQYAKLEERLQLRRQQRKKEINEKTD